MEYQRTEPKTEVVGDEAAKALLQRAYEKTSRWGDSFLGFTADLIINENGAIYKGKVTIKSPQETEVTLETPAGKESLEDWAKNQVGMMASHRASRPFDAADGKYALTFSPDDNGDHPLGRQILIHGDGMNSRYRIKEDRIRQIDRTTPRMRFTINIEETMTTADGKSLTTQYVVYYFSPDGNVSKVESFTDLPFEYKGVYLPGSRRIISNEQGGIVVRVLEFSNHALLA
jgi:hypothetical protein